MTLDAKNNVTDLTSKMLQRGRSPMHQHSIIQPANEMAMVLNLDQIMPNPDNPRTGKNPKHDEIKASIRARGLDTVLKVTKDPESTNDKFILSDGGNTRFSILRELWAETADQKFYTLQCIVKPWPGRLKCLIGHLTENEMRGNLTFIEKALAVQNAKIIHETKLQREITQAELSELLKIEGYPTQQSNISRMFQTIEHLYPCLPDLLHAGLGRPQILELLNLKNNAIEAFIKLTNFDQEKFDEIFSNVAKDFVELSNYSFDIFKENIIDSLHALTPDYTFEDWLIAVERDKYSASDVSTIASASNTSTLPNTPPKNLENKDLNNSTELPSKIDIDQLEKISSTPTQKKPPEVINQSNIEPVGVSNSSEIEVEDISFQDDIEENEEQTSISSLLEQPTNDVWGISYIKNDIDHLQMDAFKLAFTLLDETGADINSIDESNGPGEIGFKINAANSEIESFLNSLCNLDSQISLNAFFIGTSGLAPIFNDDITLKIFRLIRLVRRIKEIERTGDY